MTTRPTTLDKNAETAREPSHEAHQTNAPSGFQGQTLYLVDGSAMIFRAYHAIRPLTSRSGVPTNAVYGFGSMLLKLLSEEGASLATVCFDSPPPTFRHEMYADYKANRPPPPEDLLPQFPLCRQLTEALGISGLEQPGAEADDVIATLVRQARDKGMPVVIVSADKDLMQLVGPSVVLYDSMRDIRYGPEEVKKKFGVEPRQLGDLLALMGDSSDNIPGAPGIGPKTAAKLLVRYGDLESILAAAQDIGGRAGRSLAEHRRQVLLARRLVTLKDDLDIPMSIDDFTVGPIRAALIEPLLKELDFRKWTQDLPRLYDRYGHIDEGSAQDAVLRREAAPPPGPSPDPERYQTVFEKQEWDALLETLRKTQAFALDLETTSLDPMKAEIVGIALSVGPEGSWYVPLRHTVLSQQRQLDPQEVISGLAPLLEDPDKPKYAQNHKYEYVIFRRLGIELRAVRCDPMIASYLLDPSQRSHGLDALAKRELGYQTLTFKEVCGTGKSAITFDQVDFETATRYAAEDAEVTFLLATRLERRIAKNEQLAGLMTDLEIPLARVLGIMELNGIALDSEALADLDRELAIRQRDMEDRVRAMTQSDVNLASPKQLQKLFFEDMGLKPVKKTKTGFSTDAEVLEQLAQDNQVAALVLEHRTIAKLRSTYVTSLPKLLHPQTGRIHTSYNQAVAATGRLSSSDPNLQNIPVRTELGRRIRKAFIAPEGRLLLSADYSQIELRVLAHLSRDEKLIEAFEQGLDVHAMTAAQVFGVPIAEVTREQRRLAKAVNFGVIYGQSGFGLAKQIHIPRSDAKTYIDRYFEKYQGVAAYMEQVIEEARTSGLVTTILGRRRPLPALATGSHRERSAAERMARNTPIQGSAADIIKLAMLRCQHLMETEFSGQALMLLTVHDELVFEVDEARAADLAQRVAQEMEASYELIVPLKVDVGMGHNWDEAH